MKLCLKYYWFIFFPDTVYFYYYHENTQRSQENLMIKFYSMHETARHTDGLRLKLGVQALHQD